MGRKRKADADAPPAAEENKPVEDAPPAEAPAEDEDATDDNEDAKQDGAGDAAPVVKRGRGRPPKPGGPASAKAAVSVSDKSADGPKKGRGRPKKAIERLTYTTMTSGRPSRRSDRVREINSTKVVYRGPRSSSVPSGSALELRRLTVEQKRLSLERERFALEQERLEMDSKNWDTLQETLSHIAQSLEKDGVPKIKSE